MVLRENKIFLYCTCHYFVGLNFFQNKKKVNKGGQMQPDATFLHPPPLSPFKEHGCLELENGYVALRQNTNQEAEQYIKNRCYLA